MVLSYAGVAFKQTPWPKAEFPAILPPAKVLSALAPLGECWELRYLRRGFENGT
jgi:hypothetical protein